MWQINRAVIKSQGQGRDSEGRKGRGAVDDADEINQAGADAEAVAQAVRSNGTLDPVYSALEESLAAYLGSGGSVDDVIPGGGLEGLGFGRKSGTGRSLWQRYVDVLHDEVCKPGGELNQVLSAGLASSGAGLVTAIIALLGMPTEAAPVVAPIAGVMLALGLKAFCPQGTSSQPEAPRESAP